MLKNKDIKKILEAFDDIQVKAMMFDMDIDIETWSLTPKGTYKEPYWLTKWKAREDEADYDNRFDYDQE